MTVSPPGTPANGPALFNTALNLPGARRGKVRDVYRLPPLAAGGPDRLVIVATDRISAFDVVMPTPIPGKGRLLTEISTWWLRFIEQKAIVRTHLISTDPAAIPAAAFRPGFDPATLAGRTTIARLAPVIPIECVVRGYIEGSGWKEYCATGSVCGVKLPPGLRQCDKLPEPIFTPATKEEQGRHDENISFDRAAELVGRERMTWLRDKSLAIYRAASEHALSRGLIIADTKFEFGLPVVDASGRVDDTAEPILIDEALTPDSTRFWPADTYKPGGPQKSFDKQYLREYLEKLVAKGTWNKQAPGPALPPEIVEATLARYVEARDRLVR
ncbi:MAG: phosphoribosylaminoimidazolesuccinocarboxamide synthase [Phycisphaerales bacterium]|nr:phosphoribosylaminoimidazolesuccinocarboxamide synthase [Phycisphaerales bacterium]